MTEFCALSKSTPENGPGDEKSQQKERKGNFPYIDLYHLVRRLRLVHVLVSVFFSHTKKMLLLILLKICFTHACSHSVLPVNLIALGRNLSGKQVNEKWETA